MLAGAACAALAAALLDEPTHAEQAPASVSEPADLASILVPDPPKPDALREIVLPAEDRQEVLQRLSRAQRWMDDPDPKGLRDQDPAVRHAMIADLHYDAAWMCHVVGEPRLAADHFTRARAAWAQAQPVLDPDNQESMPPALAALQALLDGQDIDAHGLNPGQACIAWLRLCEYRMLAGDDPGAWDALQKGADAIPAHRQYRIDQARHNPEAHRWRADEWGWSVFGLIWNGCACGDPGRAAKMLQAVELPSFVHPYAQARLAAYYAGIGQPDYARERLDACVRYLEKEPHTWARPDDALRAATRMGDRDRATTLLARFRENLWKPAEMADFYAAQAQALGQRGQTGRAKAAANLALGMLAQKVSDPDYAPLSVNRSLRTLGRDLAAGGLSEHADTLAPALVEPWAKASLQVGLSDGLIRRAYPEYVSIRQPLGD